MGLFGWTSKLVETEEETTAKKVEGVTEIIEQYASKEQPVTVIKGSGVLKDLISSAKTFSEYYFNNIKNLDEIKDTIRSLESEMSCLSNLSLKNSQNYKELEEKKTNLENFVKSQQVFVNRANFTKRLVDKVDEILLISFADFISIMEKYNYTRPTRLTAFSGTVSKADINAISRIKELSSMEEYFGKWNKPYSSEITDLELASKRPELVEVYHSGDGYRRSHNTHFELIEVEKIIEHRISSNSHDMGGQLAIAEISYEYNRERAHKRNNDSYYHDDYYDYDERPIYVKNLVKNGVFEIQLPSEETDLDSYLVKCEKSSIHYPLMIQSDKNPPIVFFPWCDGIAIFRVFGEDENKTPSALKDIYKGGE